jgi:hypothetical protein
LDLATTEAGVTLPRERVERLQPGRSYLPPVVMTEKQRIVQNVPPEPCDVAMAVSLFVKSDGRLLHYYSWPADLGNRDRRRASRGRPNLTALGGR